MRIFNITISLIIVLHSFFIKGIASDGKLIEAELFTIESGMSQTRVNISFCDSYGFLWIGTSGGLNRYDGYSFEIFKHIPYDTISLSQNFIRCITEDGNSNLWVGTDYGLNCYNRQTGKFTQFFHDPRLPSSISDNQILSVYADKNGYIWLKTEQFLDKLDTKDFSIQHFKHYVNSFNNSPEIQNCPILEDKNGLIWFGSNDGLFSFNPGNAEFTHFFNKTEDIQSLSSNVVLSIYEDKFGVLWIGTNSGLNKYDPVQNSFIRYLSGRDLAAGSDLIPINAITDDLKGNFWLASNKGVILFNTNNGTSQYLTDFLINKSLYMIGPITSLLRDRSGIVWLSGFEGLFKIDTKPKKFKVYNSSFNSFPFLSGDMVSCIYKESENLIWVGVWDNGLNILNRNTGENIKYSSNNPDRSKRISSNKVRCLFEDQAGTIWLGSVNGLDIFNSETRTFIPFEKKYPSVSTNILNNRRIFNIIDDKKGDLWIGTDKGVLRFQQKYKLLTGYNKIYRDSITAEMGIVFAIACDKDNKIWIGTENGLICYDSDKDFFYRYEDTGKKNDLSSRIIYSLFFDSRNTLWVGTASGLNKYNPKEENFELFTEANGLSNDLINSILEDDKYCLWLSTNKGISKFDIQKNEFTNYDITDGLQSYEFNHAAAKRAKDGEMFFGGIAGFNSFYPQKLPINPYEPQIVFTSFEIIDNKGFKYFYSGGKNMLMEVKHNQSFQVKFAALDFTMPSNNHFEYSMQLKNSEDAWVPIRSQNSVTFSNLPPGKYTLKIKGSNNNDIWNNDGASLTITSIAPFWRTQFAIYFYFLLSVFLIYILIQYRTKSLRKSNRILRDKDIAAKEISRQKDLLSLRNKNIEDSLNYAQRIQKAMLTTPKQFRTILPDSFILHKPKDIVTGDFYWISEMDGKIFIAAADCTGHGVPGAFMSLICFELFRKIIKTEKIYNPADILNTLNSNFQEIFGNVEDIAIKDGMDLSFCVIDKAMETLEYCGAFNPLYIVRESKLIEIKGDRFSIGADIGSDFPLKIFTNNQFPLKHNDMIYMFSDGYADQFGGPEGKKYKYLRFRHLLLNVHQLPLERQKSILDESIEEWKGNSEQIDDILIIGVRINQRSKD